MRARKPVSYDAPWWRRLSRANSRYPPPRSTTRHHPTPDIHQLKSRYPPRERFVATELRLGVRFMQAKVRDWGNFDPVLRLPQKHQWRVSKSGKVRQLKE
ncbi:unnamed protein product [Nesidiocoris tenuis]|uniref:Uncharacterized protein n=2 Tax=Nesidiocoris tenuis TaxID=355587 RepID=A0A6H5H2I9_9HEMI|nr:unnamed protein product [Nesidiocoris tenuis]